MHLEYFFTPPQNLLGFQSIYRSVHIRVDVEVFALSSWTSVQYFFTPPRNLLAFQSINRVSISEWIWKCLRCLHEPQFNTFWHLHEIFLFFNPLTECPYQSGCGNVCVVHMHLEYFFTPPRNLLVFRSINRVSISQTLTVWDEVYSSLCHWE